MWAALGKYLLCFVTCFVAINILSTVLQLTFMSFTHPAVVGGLGVVTYLMAFALSTFLWSELNGTGFQWVTFLICVLVTAVWASLGFLSVSLGWTTLFEMLAIAFLGTFLTGGGLILRSQAKS